MCTQRKALLLLLVYHGDCAQIDGCLNRS